ncbi:MAG: sensor histidine kinase [Rhodoferax sp.]
MKAGLSLKRQLLIWLLLPQLVLFLVGGALAYRIALSYAEKAIDQSLTQTVRALARQIKPIGSGLLIDFPRAAQDIIEQDPRDRVSYMVSSPPGRFLLGNAALPDPPPLPPVGPDAALLYDALLSDTPVRVALIEVDYGEAHAPQRLRVQVAKGLAVQQRLTRELVADVLAPLLILSALLSVLVYAGIRRGLQPLNKLQSQVGQRTTIEALQPIALTSAPQEVHALATALNALLDAVRRSLSQEKRFLNDAAHQLRTPLAGLISQTELALRERDNPQALQLRLAKVLEGAQRSAHLVHQLLALARHEIDVPLAPLNLAALVRDVAREWAPRALAQQQDLGFEGLEHAWVLGEPMLLRELLTNLLDNALRYAGPGADITLNVARHGKAVRLSVCDTGTGVAEADLPHLFERFWRGSTIPGGCGLGLAIVAQIAARHNGTAQAYPNTPHGLCVHIDLASAPTPSDSK